MNMEKLLCCAGDKCQLPTVPLDGRHVCILCKMPIHAPCGWELDGKEDEERFPSNTWTITNNQIYPKYDIIPESSNLSPSSKRKEQISNPEKRHVNATTNINTDENLTKKARISNDHSSALSTSTQLTSNYLMSKEKMTHLQSLKKCNLVNEGYVIGPQICDNKQNYRCAACNYTQIIHIEKTFTTTRWFQHLMVCKNLDRITKYHLAKFSNTAICIETRNNYEEKNHPTSKISFMANNSVNSTNSTISTGILQKEREPSKRSINTLMNTYVDYCSEERVEIINKAIAKYLTANALPFSTIESPFFIEMIESLNKAYVPKLPKRDKFRTTYLDSLYETIKSDIDKMWKEQCDPMLTAGVDGYKGQTGDSVVNFTETAIGLSAFTKCVDPGSNRQNAQFYAREMKEIMIDRAHSRNVAVEESHAGCVADNTSTNLSAFDIIKEQYPKLLFVGCSSHVTDLLSEDLFDNNDLPIFKEVLSDVKFCVKFVRNHGLIKNAYQELCTRPDAGQKPGTMLVIFPETRFSYADLMFCEFEKNIHYLQKLAELGNFDNHLAKNISSNQTERFKVLVSGDIDQMHQLGINYNSPLIDFVRAIRKLSHPLSLLIHQLEATNAKSSWINHLFVGFIKDHSEWQNKISVKACVDDQSRQKIREIIRNRWFGDGSRLRPLKNDVFTAGSFFDPYYSPDRDQLDEYKNYEIDYFKSLDNLIKGQYPNICGQNIDQLLVSVRGCAMKLIARQGMWGQEIERRQNSVRLSENELSSCTYNIEKEILKQNKMQLDGSAELGWDILGKSVYNNDAFHDLGRRCLYIAVQSADVEQSCKAHGLIHTQVRNRLKNKTVQKLLYLYVNLRLLKKMEAPPDNFLSEILSSTQK